jgi:hypothetical protein
VDFAWTRCPLRPNPLAQNNTACPSHGRGRRFNPYSAHQPSLLRSYGWQASPCTFVRSSEVPCKLMTGRCDAASGQVHREAFEIGERAIAQSVFVRRA